MSGGSHFHHEFLHLFPRQVTLSVWEDSPATRRPLERPAEPSDISGTTSTTTRDAASRGYEGPGGTYSEQPHQEGAARHQVDLRSLQPGQPVAFWRWSGRSRQHKRGAWSLARFVSVDPDGKSVWVQINATTVKIASNQLRTACGWEQWCPSSDDIRVLKDAEMNLRENMWSDQREEPPGAMEEATARSQRMCHRLCPTRTRTSGDWAARRRSVSTRCRDTHCMSRTMRASTSTTSRTRGRP